MAAFAQMTALYFHDDQASVERLQTFLQERFGTVLIADSDFAVLKILRSTMPDLVVADLEFCTGQDLLVFAAMRQIDPGLLLLIATSDGDPSDTPTTLDPRPTKYLKRPIDLDLLEELLGAVLERAEAEH